MTDLRARMQIYDQARAPDYWSEVELRAATLRAAARPDRGPRRGLLLVGALLAILVISAAVAVGSGLVKVPPIVPVPSPAPSVQATPAVVVRGWPSTTKNSAGVYSWGGSRCATTYCVYGFMHNGYGSGDVEMTIFFVPGGAVSGGGRTAMTVAGHDGSYRRIDDQQEEWEVYVDEGKTILIHLTAQPGTSQSDLAEAHAIIDSMRTEPRDSQMGFRLLFTLTTDDWDSG